MNLLGVMTTLAAALALGACDSRDGATAGEKVDETVASARTAAEEAKQSAQKGLSEAARVTQEKSEVVAQKVGDAALTAAIKAGLAKDPELSARRINVDTKDGHVSLYGSAPNEAARQRAQSIALAENGVTGVDNQLAIERQ